jgi:hypothetical protein
MPTEIRVWKPESRKPFSWARTKPSRYSRQAYIIIKTIHLMNFTNADTLARIVKMGCSEKARAWGVFRFHSNTANQCCRYAAGRQSAEYQFEFHAGYLPLICEPASVEMKYYLPVEWGTL